MDSLHQILKLLMISDPEMVKDAVYPLYLDFVLKLGVTSFQLRCPDTEDAVITGLALRLKPVLEENRVPFFINDRPDIAMIVGADGVHLGSTDIPVKAVKKTFPKLIVGATAHSMEEAVAAEVSGADFVSIGAVFGSSTKPSAGVIGVEKAEKIAKELKVPTIFIGGIDHRNLKDLPGAGYSGVAVCKALHPGYDGTEDRSLLAARISKMVGLLDRLERPGLGGRLESFRKS